MRVEGSGLRVQGCGFRVGVLGFRVQGAGFRVHEGEEGLGFAKRKRVQGVTPGRRWLLGFRLLEVGLLGFRLLGLGSWVYDRTPARRLRR